MIDIKRIGKLSDPNRLAILFSSDKDTLQVKIENEDWITINNEEVYIFENLQPNSCYHISAKTDDEEQTIAFQTMCDITFIPPKTYYHPSGTLRR